MKLTILWALLAVLSFSANEKENILFKMIITMFQERILGLSTLKRQVFIKLKKLSLLLTMVLE